MSFDEELPGEFDIKKIDKSEQGEISPGRIEDIYKTFIFQEVVEEHILTFEQASKSLGTLGKDESGIRYAYLMITATDQRLTNVAIILKFKHVLFVDLSGNFLDLEALQVLADMPYLILIKAERNRIKSAALKPMPYLQILDLQKNQVSETKDINQPFLDTLVLNHNLIYMVQFESENIRHLLQLELRGNQLIDFSGMYPSSIEKLYLGANRISRINAEEISNLTNLQTLHLRDNKIRKLDGFTEKLASLRYLNLRNNKINKLRQFRKLKCLPKLDTLVITGNPVAGEPKMKGEDDQADDEDVGEEEEKKDVLRISLLVLLPRLKRINKDPVTPEERDEAFFVEDERFQEIMEAESSEEEYDAPTTTEPTTEYTTETEAEVEKTENEGESDQG